MTKRAKKSSAKSLRDLGHTMPASLLMQSHVVRLHKLRAQRISISKIQRRLSQS
ncbi:MAG: hypothetical protein JST44_16010 [Cyanobacteria bacterium SZAS LIN-5]|nr:hypothetical protein [Cyanobacteria bacterium SZAS LIN-5]